MTGVSPREDPPATAKRAARHRATDLALRRAALRLIEERGYEATRTDDIARAAGVSPRTFFNYFPTKEAVVFLPRDYLPSLIRTALIARPLDEDPVTSVAVAALTTVDAVASLAGTQEEPLFLASLRLMFREPVCLHLMYERRDLAVEVAWRTLQERGVSVHDLAVRSTLTAVMALGYLALSLWLEGKGGKPLVELMADCLEGMPDSRRLTEGVRLVHAGRTRRVPKSH